MVNQYNQKILDIFPPGEKEEKTRESFFIEKKINPRERKPKRRGLRLFFLLLIFLLTGGCIFVYLVHRKAEIIVWPQTQEIIFKEKLSVDISNNIVDTSSNVIPGKFMEDIQQISEQFKATGKTQKVTKAEGTIRVYNAYSTDSQTLIATTRFVSAEGKLFRSLDSVTVPGGQYENGKLIPGSADVKVQADKAGEEYNIGPSTFSIPGFAGTPRYASFYGKSSEAMKGGYSGEAPQVTKADLEKSENLLKEMLSEKVKDSLEAKDAAGVIILDEASKAEFKDISFSAKVGDKIENFTTQGQIYFKALTFRKSDIEEFVEEYILARLPESQNLEKKSLKINYSADSITFDSGKLVLNVDFSAKTYFRIPDDEVKKATAGKSLTEARLSLEKDPRIARVEIKALPSWLKSVPTELSKIRVEQKVD